jgi:dTDP-4-amino-4,6-dideoxygalactose transaminase
MRAAMGLVQLARLPAENAARARIVARYRQALDGVHGLSMPLGVPGEGTTPAHHLAVALLPEGSPRDEVRAALAERRIQTSVHYPPIHRFSQYAELGARRPLPRTEDVAARVLTLPLFAHMREEQTEAVIEALLDGLGGKLGVPEDGRRRASSPS